MSDLFPLCLCEEWLVFQLSHQIEVRRGVDVGLKNIRAHVCVCVRACVCVCVCVGVCVPLLVVRFLSFSRVSEKWGEK